jgi:hypothetical protein
MQQFALPQWQQEQTGQPEAAGAACAQKAGALCAPSSVTLNRMASSRFTLMLQQLPRRTLGLPGLGFGGFDHLDHVYYTHTGTGLLKKIRWGETA